MDAKGLIELSRFVGLLKTTPRTGWMRRHVQRPESVAEHSYRVGMLALFYGPYVSAPLDVLRCCKMALVHDLAEGVVGDLVIDGSAECQDDISKQQKAALEEAAIKRILLDETDSANPQESYKKHGLEPAATTSCSSSTSIATTGDAGLAMRRELFLLWQEYEGQESPESWFVKDLDRLEMLLQADEYEAAQPGLDLSDFFESTKDKFRSEIAKAVEKELRQRRNDRQMVSCKKVAEE